MPNPLLHATDADKRDVYSAASATLGIPATIVEKDVWICWTLDVLFSGPSALPMAFKGGTSLSKVFRAIDRFSEDIDLTIGFPEVNDTLPASQNKCKQLGEQLRARVTEHLSSVALPLLSDRLATEFDGGVVTMEDEETLVVDYPSCFQKGSGYVQERVKVEFGGRNSIEPHNSHTLAAFVAELGYDVVTPTAHVTVLAPERTFWEKVTLAHAECGRPDWPHDASRHARHWYDLYRLSDHEIGRRAVLDVELLQDVVRIKKAFYNRSTANYDRCLDGGLLLLPDQQRLELLRRDYEDMIEAGMFSAAPPTFEEIANRLTTLQAEINENFRE